MIQPPFPSTIAAQPCHITFLTARAVVRKTRNDSQTGSRAWTRQCLRRGGWGGEGKTHIMMATTPIAKRIIRGA